MKPFYNDGKVNLHCADVLEWSLWYRGEIEAGRARPFHAIVTDAPYSLGEPPPIVELLQAWLAGDKFDGFSPGFMSRVWDVMPGPQIWRALLDITYPGGYLFCFSGTRTADLLGIACRLGGWELFDRIASFAWVQAQGMGKGANISKKLDASEVVPCPDCDGDGCETCDGSGEVVGVEREVVGTKTRPDGTQRPNAESWQAGMGYHGNPPHAQLETAPATPLAQAFDGYNTQLAPKHEPVLLFRKPRDGYTFAQCAREFGSGGLWVDGCRVSIADNDPEFTKSPKNTNIPFSQPPGQYETVQETYIPNNHHPESVRHNAAGRWPPNAHFTHIAPNLCPTCNGAGCDDCHGEGVVGGCRRVGSKRVRSPGMQKGTGKDYGMIAGNHVYGKMQQVRSSGYADADGLETVDDFACVENCPIAALDEMAGERGGGRFSFSGQRAMRDNPVYGKPNTTRHSPDNYGDGSNASRFFPCHDWSLEIAERLAGETPFKYCAKSSRGEREAGCKDRPRKFLATMGDGIGEREHNENEPNAWVGNNHPTVKPLSLCKWLATLCLPPAQFNPRICIPFAGSGSEAIGAVLAGWTEIHAIEREQEYCEIAAARLAWWSKWATLTCKDVPAEIRALAEAAEAKEAWQGDERQTSMFELLSNPTKGEAT